MSAEQPSNPTTIRAGGALVAGNVKIAGWAKGVPKAEQLGHRKLGWRAGLI
jgi:hypothetical protein